MNNTDYIGNELLLFKDAINWKNYWYDSVKSYIKGDLLEVGAGMGVNTNLITQSNNNVDNILALEPDESLAKEIAYNLNGGNAQITVMNGTINDLQTDQKFDTIIYIDVIEHIKEDADELLSVQHFLKKGGHLIILVPAYNFLFSDFDKAIGHYRRYNKKILENVIPDELSKVKLFYLDSLGAFASMANKYVLKQSYPTKNQILKWDRLIIPLSKVTDKLVLHSFGKSLIGIWKK